MLVLWSTDYAYQGISTMYQEHNCFTWSRNKAESSLKVQSSEVWRVPKPTTWWWIVAMSCSTMLVMKYYSLNYSMNYSELTKKILLVKDIEIQIVTTRKSSCVTARGVPPMAYPVGRGGVLSCPIQGVPLFNLGDEWVPPVLFCTGGTLPRYRRTVSRKYPHPLKGQTRVKT